MHFSKKSSSKSSLLKSLMFLVILITGFLLMSRINRYGLPSQLTSFINTDADVTRQKMAQLTEPQQDSIRKAVAGFWVSEFNNQNNTVRKSDHLEIRDNGIIWQVINWFITFPSGDTLSLYLARTGYLMPYGESADKNGYACDVRIIRQTFIAGTDTCYGNSQVDELWLMNKSSEGLICNNRNFQSYTGELVYFFPQGMIDLVDKLTLDGCTPGANLQTFASEAIKGQMQDLAPIGFNKETMHQWISHYYGPLVVNDILHSQLLFSVPESLTVSFGISADGKVVAPSIKSGSAGRVSQLIMQNLREWEFPKHTDNAKVPTIIYTFHLVQK